MSRKPAVRDIEAMIKGMGEERVVLDSITHEILHLTVFKVTVSALKKAY